jgi:hypothetical protein
MAYSANVQPLALLMEILAMTVKGVSPTYSASSMTYHHAFTYQTQVDDGTVRTVLSPLVETDKDNDDDDASSTALGLAADGSNATTASTTALDHSVDGNDAPRH